jgi:hypothetical protein
MMLYNTQDHWVSGFCPSSRFLNNWKTFQKLDLFPASGEGRETPIEVSSF